jgi:hypothetical protein
VREIEGNAREVLQGPEKLAEDGKSGMSGTSVGDKGVLNVIFKTSNTS